MDVPRLRLLQIDLTENCPLLCTHCSNSSGPGGGRHFPLDVLGRVLAEINDLGVESLIYSGGEPLSHPDFEIALAMAGKTEATCYIFTTGIENTATRLCISPYRWGEFEAAGLVGACFSIYASPSRRETHNKIVKLRPAQGDAFSVNEMAIRGAVEAGIKAEIHFVPSDESVDDLEEVYRWACDLGCSKLHLQIPTLQGRNQLGRAIFLSPPCEARLRDAAIELQMRPNRGATFYVSRFWKSRWERMESNACAARLDQLILRTDGTVSQCNACKYARGADLRYNINTPGMNLSNLWSTAPHLHETRRAHLLNRDIPSCQSGFSGNSTLNSVEP